MLVDTVFVPLFLLLLFSVSLGRVGVKRRARSIVTVLRFAVCFGLTSKIRQTFVQIGSFDRIISDLLSECVECNKRNNGNATCDMGGSHVRRPIWLAKLIGHWIICHQTKARGGGELGDRLASHILPSELLRTCTGSSSVMKRQTDGQLWEQFKSPSVEPESLRSQDYGREPVVGK